MGGKWVCLTNKGLLCFSVFSTLLILQTLFPDKITENPDIVKTREVRKAEGFEFESGDLVFELAKVLLIICKLVI